MYDTRVLFPPDVATTLQKELGKVPLKYVQDVVLGQNADKPFSTKPLMLFRVSAMACGP